MVKLNGSKPHIDRPRHRSIASSGAIQSIRLNLLESAEKRARNENVGEEELNWTFETAARQDPKQDCRGGRRGERFEDFISIHSFFAQSESIIDWKCFPFWCFFSVLIRCRSSLYFFHRSSTLCVLVCSPARFFHHHYDCKSRAHRTRQQSRAFIHQTTTTTGKKKFKMKSKMQFNKILNHPLLFCSLYLVVRSIWVEALSLCVT